MDPITRKRIIDSLFCCYNEIGYDAWGDRIPSNTDFVAVLQDQIRNHIIHRCQQCLATNADVEEFFSLPSTEQRKMILEVGP